MKNLIREKQSLIFYLPLKGSAGKVGLSRKMISSSSVVKTTRKARRFAPFCPQLQFQAVGQEHRRSGTVIHSLLSVLKCLGLIIIIQDSKDIVIRFQAVGRAKRLAVISESSQNVPQAKKPEKPFEKPIPQQFSPHRHPDIKAVRT